MKKELKKELKERVKLRASVVAHRISKMRSGEGRVTAEVIVMLKERGAEVEVRTLSKPEADPGVKVDYVLPFHISKFDKYQRVLVWFSASRSRPDFFLNTSGVPIPLSGIATHFIYAGAPALSSAPSKYRGLWALYLLPFRILLRKFREEARKAKIIANSFYSAKGIKEVYGVDPHVIYPPVEVEFFLRAFHYEGQGYFVTVGRFERGKMLENAVEVAARSRLRGVIIGSLGERGYLNSLRRMARDRRANLQFLPDLPQEEMLEVIRGASAYFHPTLGEHFGIPVVEAMAAGLVPVVPQESGAYEVIPEYSYSTLEEAAEMLKAAIGEGKEMREEVKRRALYFSPSKFRRRLWRRIEYSL